MTTDTDLTLGQLLGELAQQDPTAPAVTCGGVTLSRGLLDASSNRLARLLHARGVQVGDHVSIALPNGPDFFIATLAAWKCGAVPQPISVRATAAEVAQVLDVVHPAAMIGNINVGDPNVPTVRPADADGEDDGPLPPHIAPVWKAMLSGGSSGTPKVIQASSPALASSVLPFAGLVDMPAAAAIGVPGPLHHNGPFLFAMIGVLTGGHVVLQERFDAEDLLALVERQRIQWLYQVPTMMLRIFKLPTETRATHDVTSLRKVVHMAAPCPPWLKEAWIDWLGPERVLEIYAATEAQAATRIDGVEWLLRRGSVGRPALGEIQVLDDAGVPTASGTVGRVWLRRGADTPPPYQYLGAEADSRPGGWECVGDLGYFDDGGYLYLTDRDTDMILVGGSNVYPAEVEGALDAHPAVLSSCVIGLPHVDLGAVPHAIVQVAEPIEVADLEQFLRERLSAYKLPRSIEFVDVSLRDDAGKVRRSALRASRIRSADHDLASALPC